MVEPDATQLSYTSSRNESPTITLGVSDNRADYSFQIAGVSDQPGSTLNLGLPAEGGNLNLQYVGATATSSVNLKMTRSSEQGVQVFSHDAIPLAGGDTRRAPVRQLDQHQPGHPPRHDPATANRPPRPSPTSSPARSLPPCVDADHPTGHVCHRANPRRSMRSETERTATANTEPGTRVSSVPDQRALLSVGGEYPRSTPVPVTPDAGERIAKRYGAAHGAVSRSVSSCLHGSAPRLAWIRNWVLSVDRSRYSSKLCVSLWYTEIVPTTPRDTYHHPDPERDERGKQSALRFAAESARKEGLALTTRDNTIRLAAEAGASLREIAEATGIPHMTVKRIIDRQTKADA